MVTRIKERGMNMLNYMIPAMVLFLSIVILYYLMLLDNVDVAHEEIHNQLQEAESYVISYEYRNLDPSERVVGAERTRLQIIADSQLINNLTTDSQGNIIETTPANREAILTQVAQKSITDLSVKHFVDEFNKQIRTNYQLTNSPDDRPMLGSIHRLSASKQIHVKQLVVIDKITHVKQNPDKKSYTKEDWGYIVYDFNCSSGWPSASQVSILVGDQAIPYVNKINSTNKLAGSTLYATIGFEDPKTGPIEHNLKVTDFFANSAATGKTISARAIPDIYVTEVMDLTPLNDNLRKKE